MVVTEPAVRGVVLVKAADADEVYAVEIVAALIEDAKSE
jgi:hypothetical protein